MAFQKTCPQISTVNVDATAERHCDGYICLAFASKSPIGCKAPFTHSLSHS